MDQRHNLTLHFCLQPVFPNQMIEQINIALDQKGSGNFSAWVIEACRRRLCSEKRVSPEANKEKSDITELLRKQIRPD
ncbi:YlcI/YnfO family protein [Escherichia coli]|uniref:YlcI/YnfO family protein n=1 Tax=Escherichia coli TaxID=562 RepID=UPI00352AB73F